MPKVIALAQDPNIELATAIYTGVNEYIRDQRLDWQLILIEHAFESHLIELAESKRLDGAIGSFVSDRWIERLTSKAIPATNLFHRSNIQSIPTAGINEQHLGYTAARHLVQQGAASLTYLGRGKLYQSTLRKAGMQKSSEVPCFDSDPFTPIASVLQSAVEMPRPIGFLCSSDRVARELTRVAEEAKLQIGKDLLLMGIGNEQAQSLFAGLELSSFRIPGHQIGFEAACLLDKQITGKQRISQLENHYSKAEFIARASSLATRKAQLVNRAKQFAQQNLSDPDFDANELATRVGSSRRTLELAMQKEGLKSPFQMITELRIARAKKLLSTTQLAISEVGQRCGYPEPHHFSAWFKKRTGVSPRNYQGSQNKESARLNA